MPGGHWGLAVVTVSVSHRPEGALKVPGGHGDGEYS